MPLPASAPAVPAAPAPEPQAAAEPQTAPEPQPSESAALPVESLLLRFRMITPAQLADAMKEEAVSGKSVATIVVEKGWVTTRRPWPRLRLTLLRRLRAEPAPAPEPPSPGTRCRSGVPIEAPVAHAPRLGQGPIAAAPVTPAPWSGVMPEPVAEQLPAGGACGRSPRLSSRARPRPDRGPRARSPPSPVPEPEPRGAGHPRATQRPRSPGPSSRCSPAFRTASGSKSRASTTRDDAKAAATEAMRSVNAGGGDWPVFSGRLSVRASRSSRSTSQRTFSGGLDEIPSEPPPGRAARPEAASSVAPVPTGYARSLRPTLGTTIAPRRRANSAKPSRRRPPPLQDQASDAALPRR